MKKLLALTVFPICATLLPAQFVLDFEGLQNREYIQDFYNGGTGSMGSSGIDYGVSFSNNAYGLIDSDAGGTGNIGLEPSPETVVNFLTGNSVVLNMASGFDTGFSFYYSSVDYSGQVNVYDGLDGTGSLLATLNLVALGYGPGDPNGAYSNWEAIGVTFAGIAKSIDFGGVANHIVFDNITFGSDNPIINELPEPAAIGMVLAPLGIGLILYQKRRKLRK